ncbi:glycoprotein-N-acetylgalactosamine 3-beta-galactosyltransferase 1-like [Drosophila ficusphila]|uniref:glycoprotein-N-acetylgalactosamine 3-beta-galactosyltransferase 1-like n=1 Tax=Drosophila ficusphila TaxID=30025 RepID=UPI0007E80922|nr:glycoprotein-N-acetylgalactosamine 3-beta-galactosyltransferase 1-like [Drosophila ficusphila]
MENLRYFLYVNNPKSPVYFGQKFRTHIKEGYMSGGAGYVLSKMALHRFMKFGFGNGSICSSKTYGYEDVELGRCLAAVGVVGDDSKDELGLARFVPFSPLQWYPDPPQWYKPLLYYTTPNVTNDCCSNSAISFHYNNAKEFYVLEYIIYKLKIFGVSKSQDNLLTMNSISINKQSWTTFHNKKTELGKSALNKIWSEENATSSNVEIKSKLKL